MIALLGATGYTGRLVAEELARRGVPHRLGARNPEKLGRLSAPAFADTFVVDVGEAGRLDVFLEGAACVISTVGPFTRLGMPVVEAAARNGVAYVDSTGEWPFMEEVYRRFGDTGSPIVPACGFDYLPGDLAAAVAAGGLGAPASRITVGYEIHRMAPSRGTVRTALDVIRSVSTTSRALQVRFPEGERTLVELPWGENVTVPRHQPGAEVHVGVVAPAAGVVAPVLGPASAVLRRVAPALETLAERLPEGPSAERRGRTAVRVAAEAVSGSGERRCVLCEGSDVYAMTARFLVQAALDVAGAGALTPAQALDPEPFLDAVTGPNFSWRRFEA